MISIMQTSIAMLCAEPIQSELYNNKNAVSTESPPESIHSEPRIE